jgi:predicted Zn finger-like uncharacterized protein
MLIVCPSCASEYMIDPGRLGAEGRTVRCASCKSTWFVTPEAEETSASEEAPPDLSANDTGNDWDAAAGAAEPVPPVRDDAAERERDAWVRAMASGGAKHGPAMAPRWRAVAGSLAILAVLAAVGAAVWGRAHLVRMVPATAALYAAVGLPVNLRGIEFRGVRSELVGGGAETFLIVEGEVANISGRDAPVPPIEIGLRGAEGQMLYTWSNDPPVPSLAAGDAVPFRARLAAPPAEARQVLVRFAPASDGAAVASHVR